MCIHFSNYIGSDITSYDFGVFALSANAVLEEI